MSNVFSMVRQPGKKESQRCSSAAALAMPTADNQHSSLAKARWKTKQDMFGSSRHSPQDIYRAALQSGFVTIAQQWARGPAKHSKRLVLIT